MPRSRPFIAFDSSFLHPGRCPSTSPTVSPKSLQQHQSMPYKWEPQFLRPWSHPKTRQRSRKAQMPRRQRANDSPEKRHSGGNNKPQNRQVSAKPPPAPSCLPRNRKLPIRNGKNENSPTFINPNDSFRANTSRIFCSFSCRRDEFPRSKVIKKPVRAARKRRRRRS